MRRRRVQSVAMIACLALVYLAGCGDDGGDAPPEETSESREVASLISHEMWERAIGGDDPFGDERPEELECDEGGYGVEELSGEPTFGVETGRCNYLTVTQPSQVEIRAGDVVEGRLWHFELTAPEDGQAYVVLMIGDKIAWEERVDIPADSELLFPSWTADVDIPAGTPVYFHVRNHGNNAWSLIEVSVVPPGAEGEGGEEASQ